MSPGQFTLIAVFGVVAVGLILSILPHVWREIAGWIAGWWP